MRHNTAYMQWRRQEIYSGGSQLDYSLKFNFHKRQYSVLVGVNKIYLVNNNIIYKIHGCQLTPLITLYLRHCLHVPLAGLVD